MPKFYDIEFNREDYCLSDDGKFWFVNVALLSHPIFKKVLSDLHLMKFTPSEKVKLAALSIFYFKSDMELFLERLTPLVQVVIIKRIEFTKKFIEYFDLAFNIFQHCFLRDLNNLKQLISDVVVKHKTDFIELNLDLQSLANEIFLYIEGLVEDVQKNVWLNKWTIANGYDHKSKMAVLYHAFLIPVNPVTYIQKFCRKDDETLMDKIENCCFCKLEVTSKVPVIYNNNYFMVECVFDPFRGRFLGMMDMINYLGRLITPMRYEFKHLITIIKVNDEVNQEQIRSLTRDVSRNIILYPRTSIYGPVSLLEHKASDGLF